MQMLTKFAGNQNQAYRSIFKLCPLPNTLVQGRRSPPAPPSYGQCKKSGQPWSQQSSAVSGLWILTMLPPQAT